MFRVVLTGNLERLAGATEIELEASDVRHMLRQLAERFPALAPHLEEGLAVAIDGHIYQDAWLEPIPPGAEVYLLPQIAGG